MLTGHLAGDLDEAGIAARSRGPRDLAAVGADTADPRLRTLLAELDLQGWHRVVVAAPDTLPDARLGEIGEQSTLSPWTLPPLAAALVPRHDLSRAAPDCRRVSDSWGRVPGCVPVLVPCGRRAGSPMR